MKSVLINSATRKALGFSIVQQLIVASSTVWISQLSMAAVKGEPFWHWLTLFFLSLTAVYLPSSLMLYFLEKAQFTSFLVYMERFSKVFWLQPELRTSTLLREARQPFVTHEAWLVISESLRFFSDWVAVILNVFFGVVALGYVLDLRLTLAYLIAIPIMLLSLYGTSKRIDRHSNDAHKARATMMQSLLPIWDNVLAGNSWNFEIWRRHHTGATHNARARAMSLVAAVEWISALTMLASLFPVLWVLVQLFSENRAHPAILAVLIATLPRHVLTIQHLSTVVQYATQYSSLRARLRGLRDALILPPPNRAHCGHISWDEIFMEQGSGLAPENPVNSLRDLLQSLDHLSPNGPTGFTAGRYTIRGANGAGKSTLLALIKQQLGKEAFLLPAHSDLMFASTASQSFSSGQKILKQLGEIENEVKVSVLLLDEWDANLDETNLKLVSARIAEMAQRQCVIEVRHREAATPTPTNSKLFS
ncbi:hypothetical protein WDW86_18175 [Bdellovibrionota bacterium FG-2]